MLQMGRINAAQAEKLYPVARMTVGRWIKAGRLAADDAGYFEPASLEACMASKRPHATREAAKKTISGRTPGARVHDPDIIDPASVGGRASIGAAGGDDDDSPGTPGQRGAARAGADAIAQGKQIDNSFKLIKAKREQLKLMADMKAVIDYNVAMVVFSLLSSALEEQFGAFDEREGPDLYALAQKSGEQEFRSELHDKIGKALRSVIALVKKETERLKEA